MGSFFSFDLYSGNQWDLLDSTGNDYPSLQLLVHQQRMEFYSDITMSSSRPVILSHLPESAPAA